MVVARPLEHWEKERFVEMAPAVRMSVPAGGDAFTRVYLRIPDGAKVTLGAAGPRGSRGLVFPPGTESDRVSYVRGRGGAGSFIDDVRGTRWDARGTEYFHVYMPSGTGADEDLVGVEWRRDDPDEERRATAWLIDWGRTHRSPSNGQTMDRHDADRFGSLNHCQSCHVADKAEATSDDDSMPPWPTDGSGLYTPAAVFAREAILSTSPTFDDPNVGDPFVTIRCAGGAGGAGKAARLHGEPGDQWLSCGAGMPVGERDLSAAMQAKDAYAVRICRARRYLVAHMDGAARHVYEPLVSMCPAGKRAGELAGVASLLLDRLLSWWMMRVP